MGLADIGVAHILFFTNVINPTHVIEYSSKTLHKSETTVLVENKCQPLYISQRNTDHIFSVDVFFSTDWLQGTSVTNEVGDGTLA